MALQHHEHTPKPCSATATENTLSACTVADGVGVSIALHFMRTDRCAVADGICLPTAFFTSTDRCIVADGTFLPTAFFTSTVRIVPDCIHLAIAVLLTSTDACQKEHHRNTSSGEGRHTVTRSQPYPRVEDDTRLVPSSSLPHQQQLHHRPLPHGQRTMIMHRDPPPDKEKRSESKHTHAHARTHTRVHTNPSI